MNENKLLSPGNLSAGKKAFLLQTLAQSQQVLSRKKTTAGFDGFVDTIVRIVKDKKPGGSPVYFNTIKEFGEYVLEKQGASFSLELEEHQIKLGGNMPIMANAMGRLGIPVNCIGAFGYPALHPVFLQLSSNCHSLSFTDPGLSTACEFNDGKMLLAQMGKINTAGWNDIKEKIKPELLGLSFKDLDLLCLLNWSEIDAATATWNGIITDVFENGNLPAAIFIDLSDCTRRDPGTIREMLALINLFSKKSRVILSLNKNEATVLFRLASNEALPADLGTLGTSLFETLKIETLVLHSSKQAIAINAESHAALETFHTAHPAISTGAGDNFNAGFCAAQLLALDLELCLLLANAVAGIYVRTGVSPEINDIINFLEKI